MKKRSTTNNMANADDKTQAQKTLGANVSGPLGSELSCSFTMADVGDVVQTAAVWATNWRTSALSEATTMTTAMATRRW